MLFSSDQPQTSFGLRAWDWLNAPSMSDQISGRVGSYVPSYFKRYPSPQTQGGCGTCSHFHCHFNPSPAGQWTRLSWTMCVCVGELFIHECLCMGVKNYFVRMQVRENENENKLSFPLLDQSIRFASHSVPTLRICPVTYLEDNRNNMSP